MTKIYKVQMNSKGMPNFSTAEEIEPCKDAISRQWLIDNIEKGEEEKGGVFDTDSDSVKNFINVAPSVTVEPKQGEWIYMDEPQNDFTLTYTCGFRNCENYKNFGFVEKCIKCERKQIGYERAVEQTEHDMLYEPTYNLEDGSM